VALVPQHGLPVDEFVPDVQEELVVAGGEVRVVRDERRADPDGAVREGHQRRRADVAVRLGVTVAVLVGDGRSVGGPDGHVLVARQRLSVGVQQATRRVEVQLRHRVGLRRLRLHRAVSLHPPRRAVRRSPAGLVCGRQSGGRGRSRDTLEEASALHRQTETRLVAS